MKVKCVTHADAAMVPILLGCGLFMKLVVAGPCGTIRRYDEDDKQKKKIEGSDNENSKLDKESNKMCSFGESDRGDVNIDMFAIFSLTLLE